MVSFFEMQFLALLIFAREKSHFWNPESKLDKIAMFLEENFQFSNMTTFDLTLIFPWIVAFQK